MERYMIRFFSEKGAVEMVPMECLEDNDKDFQKQIEALWSEGNRHAKFDATEWTRIL